MNKFNKYLLVGVIGFEPTQLLAFVLQTNLTLQR